MTNEELEELISTSGNPDIVNSYNELHEAINNHTEPLVPNESLVTTVSPEGDVSVGDYIVGNLNGLNNTEESNAENNVETDESQPESLEENLDTLQGYTIPENSETYKIHDNNLRFSGASWFDAIHNLDICLAGVGGIGSWVAFMLSRINPRSVIMYDPDVIEEVNLAGQLYRLDNIGENKVSSIAWLMRDYSNYYDITAIPRKFTSESLAYDIMICGFDNMHARKTFFRKWSNHVASCNTDASKCLFIDGRLSAEEFQIFCIRGNDDYNIDKYKKEYLFNDIEAEEDTCSYKQTSYCANMIASLMTNLLINFAHNLCNADYERELPFLTKYNAFTMYLKTES